MAPRDRSWLALTILSLAGVFMLHAPRALALEAGAARVDITPEGPIRLSGYGARTAPSEGVEDHIFGRALVLKDSGGVLTVFVSFDSIVIPGWVREEVIGDLREKLGIYHTRIVFGSTHAHTAPHLERGIPNLLALTPDEEAGVKGYTRLVIRRLEEAIESALKSLRPASIAYGKGSAAFARNRRAKIDGKEGPVEHDLPVLAALDAAGKPIAILFSYSCHATTLGGEFNRVSGEWPGEASRRIEEAHPGAVALAYIGCGADSNPDPRGTLEQVRAYGGEIARAVDGVLGGPLKPLLAKAGARIDAQMEYAQLRYGPLPTRESLENLIIAGDTPPHRRRLAKELLETIARDGALPASFPYPVQVFGFGDELAMVFLGGEVVVDYALRLRRELAPRELWISSYSNDVPCYIASKRVLQEGGYEADDSMAWYGRPARLDPSVEDTVVALARSLVESSAAGDSLARRVKPGKALSPEEGLKSIRLADPELVVSLAAAEPEVTDPVAIAWDDHGRLFVAEMRDYPLGPAPGKPYDGRIRRLEDQDLDGRYETSRLFAEGVPFPNGIAVSQNGVMVTAEKEILFFPDKDQDGIADERRLLWSGFSTGNSQHLINTIQRGIDNWYYLCGGDGAKVFDPAKPGAPTLDVQSTSFRFDPLGHSFEATSGYTSGYGIAFSDDGDRFVCDNQVHAIHVVLERRYLGRNPDLKVEETTRELSDHGRDVFPASKSLERFNDPWDQGKFSSACGVHIYGGDQLGPAYLGSHFSCEPVSNLVHRDLLEPRGATWIARRAEPAGKEFLASTDPWFRPVSCDTGPDGCLYVVDMYREVIEHPEWIPAHMQKLFDLKSGTDRGRIYRISRGPFAGGQNFDLSHESPRRLSELLSHPSRWWRNLAQRLLVERSEKVTADLLKPIVRSGKPPLARLHALWTLAGVKALKPETLLAAARDPSPSVRRAACQLAGEMDPPQDGVFEALSQESDPRVRFQLALSAGAIHADGAPHRHLRYNLLAHIVPHDSDDPWTRTAILTSIGDEPARLLQLLTGLILRLGPGNGRLDFLRGAAALVGTRKEDAEVFASLAEISGDGDPKTDHWRVPALNALLGPLGPGGLERALAAGGIGRAGVEKSLSAIFQRLAMSAALEEMPLADRAAAVDLIGYDRAASALPILRKLLEPRFPRDLQRQAVVSLARLVGPERGEATRILLEAFAGMTPPVRSEVLEAFLRDGERTSVLLDALEKGSLRPNDIDLSRRKALQELADPEQRARAEKIFAALAADPDRAKVVESYRKEILESKPPLAGDPRHGEELFLKICSVCHKAGERGFAVGADLSGMRARTEDALIADILEPSRAVNPEFQNYVLVKKDGQVLNGILATETPASVTLRRAEGKSDAVLRREIATLSATGLSLMPEGLEKELSPRDLADVIAFVHGGLGAGSARAPAAGSTPNAATGAALRAALAFHAPFDGSPDAAFSRGDRRIYTANQLRGKDVKPGLATGNVRIAKGKGRAGDALEFLKKEDPAVFFKAEGNVPYRKESWEGTISFWMSVDPEADLDPDYVDVLHLTERDWNDGALFVDFSKDDHPRHFRLGAFADREVWDPKKREWEAVPIAERPMVDVAKMAFAHGKWTHVAIVWRRFNTGKDDGEATLYLDGAAQGTLAGRRQTVTWDPGKTDLWLGLGYTGLLDELDVFDRALSAEEIKFVFQNPASLGK